MEQNQAKFESFLWEMNILELERNFTVINDFLNDKEAQEAHLGQKYKNKITTFDKLDKLEDSIQFLPDGAPIFRRQMLALLKTYFDLICSEFLTSILIAKEDQPKGNYKKLTPIEKIEALSGIIIHQSIKNVLLEMIDKRNVIIHHGTQVKVDETFLRKSIDAVKAFLELLKSACLANNIVDISSWDMSNDE